MKIDARTKLLGIIGYPIGHSLSPVLHTSLSKKYGLNFVYLAFEILPEKFHFIKDVVLTLDIRGLNITIPYKEKIIPYLDEINPLAKHVGAVNTMVNKDGKLIGYNTDIYGFTKSLEEEDLENEDVFIIGCGGVSRAIVCGLEELGVNKVYVFDIDKNKMISMKRQFQDFVVLVEEQEVEKVIPDVKMVVNATPLGMKDGDQSPIKLQLLRKHHIVYDVIYNRTTQLVEYASEIGCKKVINGIPMFVYQAEQSFFLWTGIKPDTKFIFNLVKKILKV